MPKYHMRDELKEMPGEYRQGKRHSKEDPGTYRQRMIDYLEEEPDELVLKNVLPEKLGKYRIDAGQQEERKQEGKKGVCLYCAGRTTGSRDAFSGDADQRCDTRLSAIHRSGRAG